MLSLFYCREDDLEEMPKYFWQKSGNRKELSLHLYNLLKYTNKNNYVFYVTEENYSLWNTKLLTQRRS